MVNYGQPRRLNILPAILIVAGLAAGYWLWRFFPAYFDGWTVDHILRETVSATYKVARLPEPTRSKQLKLIVDKARADIIKQGNVTDPELTVNLEIEENTAIATAEYSVVITHPYVTKTTTLHFRKVETTNIKRVEWE